jgi:cell division protein FtsI (penicillin-binding protein 3)
VLVQSSNVGVAKLALSAGAGRQRQFLTRAGLIEPMRIETGPLGAPRLPEHWREVETATIAYGYGLAVSPMQVAAATAALVNGGLRVTPHIIAAIPGFPRPEVQPFRVISETTSNAMREMMRRVVTQTNGTGRRAEVPGFDVGGKTGTAELASGGGYRARSVVASFLAAFPMSAPRYVVLITLVEPKPAAGDINQKITAGLNAAPIAARVIQRTAAALGVVPQ